MPQMTQDRSLREIGQVDANGWPDAEEQPLAGASWEIEQPITRCALSMPHTIKYLQEKVDLLQGAHARRNETQCRERAGTTGGAGQ